MGDERRRFRAAHGWAMAVILCSLIGCASGAVVASEEERAATRANLLRQAEEFESAGNHTQALVVLEQVLAESRRDYVITLRCGWAAYNAKQYDRSTDYYKQAARLNRSAIEPYLGWSLPLIAQADWDAAATVLNRALRMDRDSYTIRGRLAHVEYQRENYCDARRLYSDLARDYPSDLTVRLGLGWAEFKCRRYASARKAFAFVLDYDADNTSAAEGIYWVEKITGARRSAPPTARRGRR